MKFGVGSAIRDAAQNRNLAITLLQQSAARVRPVISRHWST